MPELVTFLVAFLVVALLGKPFIAFLRRIQAGQNVSQFLESHQTKQGTPTMGGQLILLGAFAGLAAGLIGRQIPVNDVRFFGLIGLVLGCAALGFLDDYVMPRRGQKKGLRWKPKLLLQFLVATPFTYMLVSAPGRPDDWLGLAVAVISVVWWINVFNITDGLDGLAAGLTIIAISGLFVVATLQPMGPWNPYLYATIGACAGFLWWNAPKAQMFMGDTGSMALGATFIGLALIYGVGWELFILGGLFAFEGLSIVLQLASVKLRGGKRIFRKSPLHHHFEELGWPESAIVVRFWLVGLVLLVLFSMVRSVGG